MKKRILLSLLLIVGTISTSISQNSWNPYAPVVAGGASDYDMEISPTTGELHVVTRIGTSFFIVQKYNGSTWQQLGGTISSGGGTPTGKPSIYISNSGESYVAIIEDQGGSNRVSVHKYSAGTWSNVGAASPFIVGPIVYGVDLCGGAAAGELNLAIMHDNFGVNEVIYYKNNSATWEAEKLIYNTNGILSNLHIELKPDGFPVIGFIETNGPTGDLLVYETTDGTTWTQIASPGVIGNGSEMVLKVDPVLGDIYVAYEQMNSPQNTYVSKYNGASWSGVGGAEVTTRIADGMDMIIEGSAPIVVIKDQGDGKTHVFEYNSGSISWDTLTPTTGGVEGGTNTHQYPVITADQYGAMYVLSNDMTPNPDQLQVYRMCTTPTFTVAVTTVPSCNGGNDGEIDFTANGGVPPYQFSTDNGATLQSNSFFSGLTAGNYIGYVEDANGCYTSQNINVTEPSTISITMLSTSDVTGCGMCDGTAEVTSAGGTGTHYYSWSPSGGTTATTTGLCTGIQTVTVTDDNGCIKTDIITINDPTPPSAIISGGGSYCSGDVAPDITITFTGNSGPWDFEYTDGTNNTTDVSAASTYVFGGGIDATYTMVSVSENGCNGTVSGSATYTTILLEDASFNYSSTTFCQGETNPIPSITGVTGGVFSGPGGVTMNTTTGEINLAGSTAGTYTITYTTSGTCPSSSSTTLSIIGNEDASFNYSSTTFCQSDANPTPTITGVSGGIFSSSAGIAFVSTSTGEIDLLNSTAGTYTITYTTSGTCSATSAVTITINSIDDASFNYSSTTFCQSSANATPTISGISGGTFTSSAGLTLNAVAGDIDFISSTPGTYTITYTTSGTCPATSTVTITINSSFIINEAGSIITDATCAFNDGAITGLSIIGGIGPFTYIWNGNVTATSDLSNAAPGNWVLIVADGGTGCSASSSEYTIVANTATVAVSVTGADATCFANCDGSLTATPSGGSMPYSYQWSTGGALAIESNLCAGTYTVIATDANGCVGTGSATVGEPLIMVLNVTSSTPGCGDNFGSASVSVQSGGTAPYTYSWTSGDTTSIADSLSAGMYMVQVTDANGCLATDNFNLTSSSAPSVFYSLTTPTCVGSNDGEINIAITGGTAPFTFDWSSGENTEDVVNKPAGLYDVEVIDANGCAVIESIILPDAPIIDLSSSSITPASCSGADGAITVNGVGGTGALNYQWDANAGSQTSASAIGLSAGVYVLSVTDDNGCVELISIAVSNSGAPIITIDQINEPTCVNGGGMVDVSVTSGVAPYTYNWSNGSTNEDLLSAPVNNYNLNVTDASGCTGMLNVDLVGINLSPQEICMVTVDTATGANLVVWNKVPGLGISDYQIYRETSVMGDYQMIGSQPYDSLTQFVDSAANSSVMPYRYKLTTIDSCGNTSSFLAMHKTIHLIMNLGLSNTVNLQWDDYIGFSYSSCYINRYHSSTGWVTIDTVSANVHSYTDSDYPDLTGLSYSIEVRPNTPCSATKAQDHNSTRSNRTSINDPGPTSVQEQLEGVFTVIPNPNNGIFTIQFEKNVSSDRKITITDLQGKVVMELYSQVGEIQKEINLSKFENGLYLVKVSSDLGTQTVQRVVKQ